MTMYCNSIRQLSRDIWHYMSDVYRYNLKVSELGITNHLIYDVVNFYAQTGIFCDVFCLDSKYENIRGADLDLFIKNRHGKFNYFMISIVIILLYPLSSVFRIINNNNN